MVISVVLFCFFFFFKQKTAYEMRISDWSSDVCSSDLFGFTHLAVFARGFELEQAAHRFFDGGAHLFKHMQPGKPEKQAGADSHEYQQQQRATGGAQRQDRKSVV